MALAINNTFNNINGLFGTIESTAQAFKNLFGFGNSDQNDIETTTASLVQRRQNRDVLNRAVNAQALSYAYVAVAQIPFETVDEIETAERELEVQYEFIISNPITDSVVTNVDASQAVNDSLTDMRVIVQAFFDEQRISAKQIISVFTTVTSARLLSFQYYAETESVEDIIALNEITDVSFVEGDVRILTA